MCAAFTASSNIMSCHHATSRRLCILALLCSQSATLPCTGFVLRSEPRMRRGCGVRRGSRFDDPGGLLASPQAFDITPDLVRKTAELAQIQVTDEEVNVLAPRMEEFLGFVEKMEEIPESSDGAFATLNCGNDFLREDNAEKFSNVAAVIENMPVEESSFLRVPKVGEDEG